jgi:hypothetical protein
MGRMFSNSQFNQIINNWCVDLLPSEPSDFSTDGSLSADNKPKWGVCAGKPGVVTMESLLNNTALIPTTTQFTWLAESLSTKYQLQIVEGLDQSTTVFDSSPTVNVMVDNTTYTVSTRLRNNRAYGWRVRGYNESLKRYGDWSPIWSFTISGEPIEDQDIDVVLNERWNLVGLPVQQQHANFKALFPNAVEGTLFSYDNTYQSRLMLQPGIGYWVRLEVAGTGALRGAPIPSLELELKQGWNLVSGPTGTVSVANISDAQEILIAGSVFGFNGSYVSTSTLEPGKGYWVRTNQAGSIQMEAGVASKQAARHPSEALRDFDRLEILYGNDERTKQPVPVLYLNGVIPSPYTTINFELPPIPPAGNVDVRWEHGSYVSESKKASALVQQGQAALTIRFTENSKVNGLVGGPMLVREFIGDRLLAETLVPRTKDYTLSSKTDRLEFELIEIYDELPVEFTLDQNYPNPFNPTTTIRFGLPEPADVSLEVYTVLGQKVMTLVNENRSAGWHTVNFNGANLSSGVYIYRINAGNFVTMKKLMLVK